MFFLLRMVFWLGVVCVLLPGDGMKSPKMDIDTAEAVSAAASAMSDMRGFCERQPDACVVGGKVAVALGEKAQAGAKTIYDFISEQMKDDAATGSTSPKPASMTAAAVPAAKRGTLTPADLTPAWQGLVPLPPRREARLGRPSA